LLALFGSGLIMQERYRQFNSAEFVFLMTFEQPADKQKLTNVLNEDKIKDIAIAVTGDYNAVFCMNNAYYGRVIEPQFSNSDRREIVLAEGFAQKGDSVVADGKTYYVVGMCSGSFSYVSEREVDYNNVIAVYLTTDKFATRNELYAYFDYLESKYPAPISDASLIKVSNTNTCTRFSVIYLFRSAFYKL
jgi:hypothetical protein